MKIGVLALGNWGTALADHLARKGLEVVGWSRSAAIVAGINNEHRNPTCLTDIVLDPRFRATTELTEATNSELIVIACPSAGLADVLHHIVVPADTIVVSAVKGLDVASLKTPLQLAADKLGATSSLVVLSGPSFARDVVNRRPLGVVSASRDGELAEKVATIFSSKTFKVYPSVDPLGVELGGIVKNVIALAVGVSDGLGYGDSARAGLITRGLAEMMRLADAMGADIRTLSGLSGLGDLVMTASSDLSRNRTVGLRMGRGEKLSEIVATLGSVAEAVETAPAVIALAQRHNVDMPITTQVTRLVRGEATASETAKALLSRPMRKEFGD